LFFQAHGGIFLTAKPSKHTKKIFPKLPIRRRNAFEQAGANWNKQALSASESGGKPHALQTLRAVCQPLIVAKRLECGRFSAAFRPSTHSPQITLLTITFP
jgi:hypothetical protein